MTSITIGDRNIQKPQQELGEKVWPPFMQHDSIVNKYWDSLYKQFIDFQFAKIENNNLVAAGNAIPVCFEDKLDSLPDTGLDWAMEKANDDYKKELQPNLLVAVQVLINPEYQGKGISYEMLNAMKEIALKNKIRTIALPVRPTLKHLYPLIPIEDYINWKNNKGEAFDPWIRVHQKAEGKIIKPCKESMNISAPIELWKKWTGADFQSSGKYIVDKALTPIEIDIEQNIGRYIEPNVWVVYEL